MHATYIHKYVLDVVAGRIGTIFWNKKMCHGTRQLYLTITGTINLIDQIDQFLESLVP